MLARAVFFIAALTCYAKELNSSLRCVQKRATFLSVLPAPSCLKFGK